MSLFTASLNSGSNGNCYYVSNGSEAVLIDAGISCRETERRMKQLELRMDSIKAVFISHEHGDHIKGVEGLVSKYQLPIYITAATLQHSRLRIPQPLVKTFVAHEPVVIGGLSVLGFPKKHDAIDPHSFVVSGNGIHVGVFTDIGSPCRHVVDHFTRCHAIFLEANYDEQLLEQGRYPIHLKRRIAGDEGHLSNRQAAELLAAYRPAHMQHVFLSHLSQDNNRPEVALAAFSQFADTMQISVASRYEASGLFEIASMHTSRGLAAPAPAKQAKAVQISLF